MTILEKTHQQLSAIVEQNKLLDVDVSILAKPLTPEEAIGTPGRRDFPIIVGKERILEATFLDAKGHAFTDAPREFLGNLEQVLALPLDSNSNRAIFVATLNAVMRHLGRVEGTVHCKDDDPEKCGDEIARTLLDRHGKISIGMIGMNPAIAENLVRVFGVDRVFFSDLFEDNIGKEKFGVVVWDGRTRTEELVDTVDLVLFTGTTLQNGTFDDIWSLIQTRGKKGLVYGVTAAGVAALNSDIERICPCGR